MKVRPLLVYALATFLPLSGCVTTEMKNNRAARRAMEDAIRQEEPGSYYIGRRYYKVDYKFWGFVRKPGEQWNTAKLVMMNEQTKLAPDRELGKRYRHRIDPFREIGQGAAGGRQQHLVVFLEWEDFAIPEGRGDLH